MLTVPTPLLTGLLAHLYRLRQAKLITFAEWDMLEGRVYLRNRQLLAQYYEYAIAPAGTGSLNSLFAAFARQLDQYVSVWRGCGFCLCSLTVCYAR